MSLAPDDARHGTANGYHNLGCRCEPCRAAGAVSNRQVKERRMARVAADPTLIPHGTANGAQNYDCRCEPCVEARRAARRVGTPRLRPACGTEGGYHAHWRRGETTCQPCRDAHAAYQRERVVTP